MNGILTVVPPPGQQYGQPGVSGFEQTQYGGPPPSYGQTMQYGQQNGFGQPVGDQFSYGGQKYWNHIRYITCTFVI